LLAWEKNKKPKNLFEGGKVVFKKLMILSFGLMLIFTLAMNISATVHGGSTPVPEDQRQLWQEPEGDTKAPCYWQWWYTGAPAWFYRVPYGTDILEVAERFSTACSETLMGVNLYIYDAGGGTFGNDDIYITAYDDDGSGFPGLARGSVTLPAGTYNAYPTPTYADFSALGLVFTGDFHIGFTSSGLVDYECPLSDDEFTPTGRGSVNYQGTWMNTMAVYGTDVDFMFEVYMCTDWQWLPGDEHKMHYPQLPDEVGWDVNATYPEILADDWRCSETGWIKDVHFWGSWKDNFEGIIDSFLLSFHRDIPAGFPGPYGSAYADGDVNHDGIALTVGDLVQLIRILTGTPPPIPFDYHADLNGDCVIDMADAVLYQNYFTYGISVFDPYGGYPVPTCSKAELYSRPGEIIDTMVIKWFGITQMSPSDQGWYDPVTDEYIENNHWDWYQYDICLPESNWVWQDQDSIYWLNISAFVNNEDVADTAFWGWKSSYMHFNDDAAWTWSDNVDWGELYEPPYYGYIPGDVDDDGDVDSADVVYLQNWVAGGGPPPPYVVNGFYPAADINGDCAITVADIVFLINYLYSGGPAPTYCYLYPPSCNYGTFGAEFDAFGNLINGWGGAFFGEGWYLYEMYGWWNMWWYDHPLDTLRKKIIHYEVDFVPTVEPGDSGYVVFAVNWSTDLWDDEASPPMPGVNEDMYIGRDTLYAGYVLDSTHMSFDYVISEYNPIWVSVDVMAENIIVEGGIEHCCVKSLDLSFVITGESPNQPPPPHEGDVIFHNINNFRPVQGNPIGTHWHELWPNFCERWDLTSWFDNGDGILSVCDYVDFTNVITSEWRKFHVEWVGPTLELEWDTDTIYVEYICFEYPLVDTIFNPIGTWWHEVHPNYCETWGIIDWVDNGNGFLDFCDWIYIQNYNTGEIRYVHVAAVQTDIILNEIIPTPPDPHPEGTIYHYDDDIDINLYDPIGGMWHELYPTYCEMWELTSWFDNGDELLSVCDYVDFTSPDGLIWEKFHVDWIGWTIEIERVSDPTYPIYLDFYGDGLIPLDVIIGTYWHEVYPNYCTNHFCVDWIDNGTGMLDSCDYLILQNMTTGEFDEYHVTGVKVDIILDPISPVPPEPLPEGINLHNPQNWRPPMGSPIETYWHELYPNYCQEWLITSWIDNGDEKLSVCDTLDINNNPDTLYHVDWVGPTIVVEHLPTEPQIYLDYVGFDNPDNAPMNNVVGTYWHEVYPVFCPYWYVVEWIDNGSGYLDSCDYLVIQHMDDGSFDTYHVIDVQTDMVINPISCGCDPGNVNADTVINIFDITYIISYLYRGGPAPTPYPLCNCDMNCDCVCNIFDITGLISYLYLEGTPPCTCQDWLNACGPPLRK
jgi:hypothetical protein